MQERMEESRERDIAREERKRFTERELQLREYRDVIEKLALELDVYRSRLKEEQLAREKKFQRELEAREQFFAEREKKLFERQREFENRLAHRQSESETLRAQLQNEISTREAKLQQDLLELQQEKERYNEESRTLTRYQAAFSKHCHQYLKLVLFEHEAEAPATYRLDFFPTDEREYPMAGY